MENDAVAAAIRSEVAKICEICHDLIRCLSSFREAEPLRVKHSVLNQMSIAAELKHEIWLGARCNGPLVQRVSDTVMAVKCRPDERHPLGYLHVQFQVQYKERSSS